MRAKKERDRRIWLAHWSKANSIYTDIYKLYTHKTLVVFRLKEIMSLYYQHSVWKKRETEIPSSPIWSMDSFLYNLLAKPMCQGSFPEISRGQAAPGRLWHWLNLCSILPATWLSMQIHHQPWTYSPAHGGKGPALGIPWSIRTQLSLQMTTLLQGVVLQLFTNACLIKATLSRQLTSREPGACILKRGKYLV